VAVAERLHRTAPLSRFTSVDTPAARVPACDPMLAGTVAGVAAVVVEALAGVLATALVPRMSGSPVQLLPASAPAMSPIGPGGPTAAHRIDWFSHSPGFDELK